MKRCKPTQAPVRNSTSRSLRQPPRASGTGNAPIPARASGTTTGIELGKPRPIGGRGGRAGGIKVRNMISSVTSEAKPKPSREQQIQLQTLATAEHTKFNPNRAQDITIDSPDITAYVRKSLTTRTEEALSGLNEDFPIRLRISTISSKLIIKKAVVQVTEKDEDPANYHGVNSYLMGSPSVNKKCQTCGQIKCPGHYGYIALNHPVIHPVFERAVFSVLDCICHCCGVPLHTKESALKATAGINAATSEWGYLSALQKASIGLRCQVNTEETEPEDGSKTQKCASMPCRRVNLSKSKGQNLVHFEVDEENTTEAEDEEITAESSIDARKMDKENTMTPDKIWQLFDSITNEGARILGFNADSHPRDLILKTLAVIPPIARPPVYESGETKSDQLTRKYSEIVAMNNVIGLKPSENTKDKAIRDLIYELIIDDKATKKYKRMKMEKMFSIFLRIKGKDGLLRGAMQGKRIDYSARAVLSPATYLRFGELGVPVSIASVWGVTMVVTQANIGYIRELLLSKPSRILKHTPKSGPRKNITVKYVEGMELEIKQGDEVERWCQDGDYIIFNRQPTIHSGSILGYTVKVLYDRDTIGVHPSACGPHNADFDGDAATIHLPRSPEAIAEVRDLLHITKNIIDRKTGKPMVGLIMDSCTYAFLMTDPRRGLDEYTFRELLAETQIDQKPDFDLEELQERAVRYGLHPWSGRTLFSALLPKDFKYNRKGLLIEDGILVAGRVTESHLGATHRSIIQDLHDQYGDEGDKVATDFITYATWLLIAWGNTFGFSIGPADCEYGRMGNTEELRERELINAKIESEVDALGPRPTDPVLIKNREDKIRSIVDQSKLLGKNMAERNLTEKCPIKGRQNTIGCMAEQVGAGTKAKLFNIAQIGGSVGQQSSKEGTGLPALLSEGRRALPTQPKRPIEMEAPPRERGFCISSYMEGLTPDELYYIIWGGRPGLIDTNLSTADVGFAQRLFSKAGENIIVGMNGEIYSIIGGYIYSFGFGGDGLDPAKMMNVEIDGEGVVASFCDLGDIIDKGNAMVGWVHSDIEKHIQQNQSYIPIIDAEIIKEQEIGLYEIPDYIVYDDTVCLSSGGFVPVNVPANVDVRDLIRETTFPLPVPKQIITEPFKPYKTQRILQRTPQYMPGTPIGTEIVASLPEPPKTNVPPIDPNIVKRKRGMRGETPDEYLIQSTTLAATSEPTVAEITSDLPTLGEVTVEEMESALDLIEELM